MKSVIFLSAAVVSNLFSQTDSLNKKVLKFNGVSLELGGLMTPYGGGDVTSYKTIFPNDALLSSNFTNHAYSEGYNFPQGYSNFLSVCAKSFFSFSKKSKISKEIFIGLRYQKTIHSGFSYINNSPKVTQNYINTTSQDTVFRVIENENITSFGVVGKQLFLPIGFNITTKKERRFWLTAGLCLAPGINFNTLYKSTAYNTNFDYITKKISDRNTFEKYSGSTQNTFATFEQRVSPSFAFYSSLPLTVNIRASKKIKLLKNTNLFVCTEPVYYYSKIKNITTNSGFTWANSFGIRANW